MSQVWVLSPSKRPATEVQKIIDAWHTQGYKVAIWRDAGDELVLADAGFANQLEYPGYYECINRLAKHVLKRYPDVDWVVAAADDILPDPGHRADEIAAQCSRHFGGVDVTTHSRGPNSPIPVWFGEHATFGVMQPTGDGHGIETICGSPWLGREWCERAYGGRGPVWPFYRHMFGDQDLQEVAKKLGVLWQRPDLRHIHNHWSFQFPRVMPGFAMEANSPEHWNKYRRLFSDRQAAGFPGCDPLPAGKKATQALEDRPDYVIPESDWHDLTRHSAQANIPDLAKYAHEHGVDLSKLMDVLDPSPKLDQRRPYPGAPLATVSGGHSLLAMAKPSTVQQLHDSLVRLKR